MGLSFMSFVGFVRTGIGKHAEQFQQHELIILVRLRGKHAHIHVLVQFKSVM